MFEILGIKENIKNVLTLAKPFMPANTGMIQLKKAYHTFLNKVQPMVPRNDNIDITFLHNPKDIKLLLQIFEEDSVLDDFEQIFDNSNLSGHEIIIDKVKKCLNQMDKINNDFFYLLKLIINTIFAAPSKLAGGGSTSAAIGCIWINLREHWKDQDIIEFLIHEATHNLVFLDELCYTHYSDYSKVAKEENFSWSAILNRLRPLDKVFHSIIVSTEVLFFRKHHLGHPVQPCLHPTTEVMLTQTLHSINYFKDNLGTKNLLSKRGNFLLELCENKLKSMENSTIALNCV